MDSINAGFEKVFPELGIITSSVDLSSIDTLKSISRKIAPFIRAMLDSGEYDEFTPGMALDVFQLLPGDYMEYLHGGNCEIHYFLTSDVTNEERFSMNKFLIKFYGFAPLPFILIPIKKCPNIIRKTP